MELDINPKIEVYNKELIEDIKLSEMNIKQKSLETPALKAKWLRKFFAEQWHEKKLARAKEILTEEYIKNHGKMGVAKFRVQGEAEQSTEILAIDRELIQQRELLRYLDSVLKIMSSFGFDTKNVIDIMKLENS